MLPSSATYADRLVKLTSGSLLARNTLINLLGQVAPLPVAIVTFPRILDAMGAARFGILSLAWVLVGYFGLLDLGLGRALTTLVAEKIGAGREQDIPRLVWTALVFIAALGILGAAVVGLLAPSIADRILAVPLDLRRETVHAFTWLALGLPALVFASALMGILTALQRFDVINAVRAPITLFTYVSPLLVLPFTRDLSAVVAVLVAGRMLGCLVYLACAVRLLPALAHGVAFDRVLLRPLVRFGGWMTVSNIVGPMMVYLDRFLIGAVVSVASVVYYTVPYDVGTKILVVPLALVGVLFPAFTTTFAHDRERTFQIYDRSIHYSLVALFPVILVMVAFAREGLTLWLGEPFAARSTLVLQVLAFGVLFNSLAQPAFALIQGLGRPDLTARLHLLELPAYLVALWWASRHYGIDGAALVWTLRVAVDLVALCAIVQRLFPAASAAHRRALYRVTASSAVLAIYLCAPGPWVKVPSVVALLVLFGAIAWFSIRGDATRLRPGRWLKRGP